MHCLPIHRWGKPTLNDNIVFAFEKKSTGVDGLCPLLWFLFLFGSIMNVEWESTERPVCCAVGNFFTSELS